MNQRKRNLSLASILIIASFSGCTVSPTFDEIECDQKIDKWTAPPCREAGSDPAPETDAGTDANTDTDASSVVSEIPPLQPEDWKVCPGSCLPEPSDTSAGSWPSDPLLVWMGPLSEMPTECPPEAPFMKWKRYDKLVAPPAQCETCSCEASGACTGLPASIDIHNGACNAAGFDTRPFDGPANWDGSCTSINAMPAGTLCNGVPCAQSVYSTALPGPSTETCTPTNEKPSATTEYHWEYGALACGAPKLEGACADSPNLCVQTLPEPWLHCVAVAGIRDECPGNYEIGPFVRYPEQPIDDRGCSDCSCGSPSGICVASLRVYSDANCANQFLQIPLSSIDDNCGGVTPAGKGIGSKAITDLDYLPGTCTTSGGSPIGMAIPNSTGMTEATTPVTFCCRSREDTEPKTPGVPS